MSSLTPVYIYCLRAGEHLLVLTVILCCFGWSAVCLPAKHACPVVLSDCCVILGPWFLFVWSLS